MNRSLSHVLFGFLLVVLPADRLAAEQLQREGRYIRLTTDLASAEEAESLVASFDAAAVQWAQFWQLSSDTLANWKVEAFVIRNREEFERQGQIPDRVPDFPFGYALGNQIWVLAQQSEYYTRHLLLHEGVHSLAFHLFGGAGPAWYREGTAELLSTHRGVGAGLKVNQIPSCREDVPYWGRFKRLAQLRGQGEVPSLGRVMGYASDLRGDVGVYGWSWAAAMLFDSYPDTRQRFLAAARNGRDDGPGFNRRLQQAWRRDWPVLSARWQLMCHDLDYGFDRSRQRVELSISDPIWDGKPIQTQIAADQGWQSIGVRVPRGARVQLTASGRVTLADTPKPWSSGPDGITFQYHRGRPLGQLLICVLPNAIDSQAKYLPSLDVRAAQLDSALVVDQYSWVLMRVNDGVGQLGDNAGAFDVKMTRL